MRRVDGHARVACAGRRRAAAGRADVAIEEEARLGRGDALARPEVERVAVRRADDRGAAREVLDVARAERAVLVRARGADREDLARVVWMTAMRSLGVNCSPARLSWAAAAAAPGAAFVDVTATALLPASAGVVVGGRTVYVRCAAGRRTAMVPPAFAAAMLSTSAAFACCERAGTARRSERGSSSRKRHENHPFHRKIAGPRIAPGRIHGATPPPAGPKTTVSLVTMKAVKVAMHEPHMLTVWKYHQCMRSWLAAPRPEDLERHRRPIVELHRVDRDGEDGEVAEEAVANREAVGHDVDGEGEAARRERDVEDVRLRRAPAQHPAEVRLRPRLEAEDSDAVVDHAAREDGDHQEEPVHRAERALVEGHDDEDSEHADRHAHDVHLPRPHVQQRALGREQGHEHHAERAQSDEVVDEEEETLRKGALLVLLVVHSDRAEVEDLVSVPVARGGLRADDVPIVPGQRAAERHCSWCLDWARIGSRARER